MSSVGVSYWRCVSPLEWRHHLHHQMLPNAAFQSLFTAGVKRATTTTTPAIDSQPAVPAVPAAAAAPPATAAAEAAKATPRTAVVPSPAPAPAPPRLTAVAIARPGGPAAGAAAGGPIGSQKRKRDEGVPRGDDEGATFAYRRSNTNRMHERNSFRDKNVNFQELAARHPEFAKYVRVDGPRTYIDFTDPAAVRQLTTTLFMDEYKLVWSVPDGRLCPALGVRLNYVHWVADLLQFFNTPAPKDTVVGVDIGTGASCVYPLLGFKEYGWNFIATESDAVSVASAVANVTTNHLEAHIQVRQVPSDVFLVGALKATDGRSGEIDFTMCNPPFYASAEEIGTNPNTVCTGAPCEMVYPGGELGFLTRLIEDSAKVKDTVRWFTSMLGKKSSLRSVLEFAAEKGATAMRTCQFLQGRTTRWGVAWTFRPLDQMKPDTPHQVNKTFAHRRPGRSQHEFSVPVSVPEATKRIHEALQEMHATLDEGAAENDAHIVGTVEEETKMTYGSGPVSLEIGFDIKVVATDGGGAAVTIHHDSGFDKLAFQRFADTIQRDTVRSNRKWRRLAARTQTSST